MDLLLAESATGSAGERQVRNVVFTPELVVRASTGPGGVDPAG